MEHPPLTLSVREAATHLGVSRNTVYDMVRAGDIPHLRIGTRVRIPTEPLRQWIAARTEGHTWHTTPAR